MNSVLKGASYILAFAPDMVVNNGTTQTMERMINPGSDYLKEIHGHLRSYDDARNYMPNQVYIGNMTPDELGKIEQPWVDKPFEKAERFGKFGEIMPEDEFYLFMQVADVFDLVRLEAGFAEETKAKLAAHPLMDESIISKIKTGVKLTEIESAVNNDHAEPLYLESKLIGCVKKAHDIDSNLSAHVILENLVSKASCALSILHLINNTNVQKSDIDYVIDCSEEAVGDMNQRGGGNMAKAAAEIAGLVNASGADIRAFCAAPAHAVIHAAALVASGAYDNIVVAAGGSTAKLGMNGKDHVKKGLPILEDVVGGFGLLISKNDGVNPEILSFPTGRHTVGSGSSPQTVITALVSDPLDKIGLRIIDIDKYSVEMQNPDVTKPAGAGDVPNANYKMIGALAVKRGELERTAIDSFTAEHGMVGWAPTQGHIPSGVPYMGFGREDILEGKVNNAMIIGKGSLFLGRMTNLFDGVSFIIQKNSGTNEQADNAGVNEEQVKGLIAHALRELAASLSDGQV